MKKLQSIFLISILALLIISCSNDSNNSIKRNESINHEKTNGFENQKSTKDETTYQELTKYLKKRNLEFCAFSNEIEKMEIECIHKADAVYPDFGIKHNEYVEELTAVEIKKLGQKHNISDSIFPLIAILSSTYCH